MYSYFGFLSNSQTWLCLAFILLIVFTFKIVRKAFFSFVDDYAEKIKKNFSEAEHLLREAMALLHHAKVEHDNLVIKINEMRKLADEEISFLRQNSSDSIIEFLDYKKGVEAKLIDIMQKKVYREVKEYLMSSLFATLMRHVKKNNSSSFVFASILAKLQSSFSAVKK